MEKFKTPEIRTGEFAKMCGTTKRTLLHYDEIGLFSPEYVDDNGYRYYSQSQSDVFYMIDCLRELGMPLREIRAYIDRRGPQALKELLGQQEQIVATELERLNRIAQVIRTRLELIRVGESVRFPGRVSPLVVEHDPEAKMVVSAPLESNDQSVLLRELLRHIEYCLSNGLNTGHPWGSIMRVDGLKSGEIDPYLYFMTRTSADTAGHPVHIRPAGLYACVYLRGNYYDADDGFQKLLRGMESEGMIPDRYCYKEAIWDELTVNGTDRLITRISIGIAGDES